MYDYNKNINVITTPNSDKVVTMNEQIFTIIGNALFSAAEFHEKAGRNYTAEDLYKLHEVFFKKGGE